VTATSLPQLDAPLFVTDGGLETCLVFHAGIDLPDFAAFPLVDSDEGRAALREYFEPYLELAEKQGVGIVLDTPTWRANPDWGARLGYDADRLAAVNRRAVEFTRDLAREHPSVPVALDGVLGPRGDGYVVGAVMTPAQAADYHGFQIWALRDAGADMVTAVTMTYVDEAIGVADAARSAGLPVVVSFTVETDGRLPSGETLADAIGRVDGATDGFVAYFMINCAHPTHFASVLDDGGSWLDRVGGIRANASKMSHAELDEAEELDRGDPVELAAAYCDLRARLPELRVVGGCCGTDIEHVTAITEALTTG
jgi:S-methylmethionine-dependent homocysteine/selenocysteine methylase